MTKIIKITCLSLLVLGLLSFAYPVLAQGISNLVDCRKGHVYCEYPGDCRDYIDTNNDGYCDLSIPVNKEETATASQAANISAATASAAASSGVQTQQSITAAAADGNNVVSQDNTSSGVLNAQGGQNRNADTYNLLLIIIAVAATYTDTYLLTLTRALTYPMHTKIWNIILLISTLVMLILGFLLTLEIDYRLNLQMPFDMTFWHVETGIIMGVIAVFHISWHWRYFYKLFKRKSRPC